MQNFRAKFSCLRRLFRASKIFVPPATGGFALKPPASGSWGLRPQTLIGLRRLGAPPPDPLNSPPHCEFLATRLGESDQFCQRHATAVMPTPCHWPEIFLFEAVIVHLAQYRRDRHHQLFTCFTVYHSKYNEDLV